MMVKSQKRAGKTMPWVALVIACLGMLVVLFYVVEDARGGMAWSKFKRAEEAKGEKFNLADFIPPAVPDDQNFAMTPLLRTTFDYFHTTNGVQWRDTNAWAHLSRIRVDLASSGDREKAPDIGDWEAGTLVDLNAAANFYRGNTNYPQSAIPGSAAEDVLTALSKFDPDLKELREAAATRPLSRFPIEYGYEPPSNILLPHLACVREINLVCELRAVAELETHRPAEALADLQIALRMSDSVREEPFLVDHLVRIYALTTALQGIREGLVRHAWTDPQLIEFEKYLANIDLLHEYEHAMRSERCLNLTGVDYVRRHGTRGNPLEYASGGSLPGGAAFDCIPSGWFYQNMRLIGDCYRDFILPSVDESNRLVFPEREVDLMRNLEKRRMGPYTIFAKLLIPALGKAAQRSASTQTFVDETRVACALEHYRLAHNELPDTLDALVPQFISKIPNDLFDGKPLRFKKNADGTCVVYSIGWDEKDVDGVVVMRPGRTPRADPNKGDWVWKYATK